MCDKGSAWPLSRDAGHKVVEVGTDFVVVEDIAGVQQLRIPVFSINSIGITKSGKAK
jgi:hypothetical protein